MSPKLAFALALLLSVSGLTVDGPAARAQDESGARTVRASWNHVHCLLLERPVSDELARLRDVRPRRRRSLSTSATSLTRSPSIGRPSRSPLRVAIALRTPPGQCEYTPLYPPFVRGEH